MKKALSYVIFLIIILAVGWLWQQRGPFWSPDTLTNDNTPKDAPLTVTFVFDKDEEISLEYPYVVSHPKDLFTLTRDACQEQNWNFNFNRKATI